MNNQKNYSGSFTAEAAIVSSTCILCVSAIIFIIILIFQFSYLHVLSQKGANCAALLWNGKSMDQTVTFKNNVSSYTDGLYWYFFENGDNRSRKNEFIKDYIKSLNNLQGLIKSDGLDVTVSSLDSLLDKRIVVKVSQKYYLPGGGLLKSIGLNDYFLLESSSESKINVPAENIRNVDEIFEIIEYSSTYLDSFKNKFENFQKFFK